MTQELIYTSAPKGLKLGSRGFCTVASTQGMAKNLADRLEALSGYKHLFSPDDPLANLNPTNVSYLRFKLGGRIHYLLSRIADAGLDYTERTNKLAHHIVLDRNELLEAGPAWLASQAGFFETTWTGQPRHLPSNRSFPARTLQAKFCKTWKAVAGDAGWAGVLAESLAGQPASEAYLLCKPGTQVLTLFLEAQSLLPADKRWNATFSTYFTKVPPGVECRWRCVIDGTAEAARLRKSPKKLVIDLAGPLPVAEGGELVEAARTGTLPKSSKPESRLPEEEVVQRVAPPIPVSRPPARPSASQQPPALPSQKRGGARKARRSKKSSLWKSIAIAGALMLAMIAGAVGYSIWFEGRLPEAPVVAKSAVEDTSSITEEPSGSTTEQKEVAEPTMPSTTAKDDHVQRSTETDNRGESERNADQGDHNSTIERPPVAYADENSIPKDLLKDIKSPISLPVQSKSGFGAKNIILGSLAMLPPTLNISMLKLPSTNHQPTIEIAKTNESLWTIYSESDGSKNNIAEIEIKKGTSINRSPFNIDFHWVEPVEMRNQKVIEAIRHSGIKLCLPEANKKVRPSYICFFPKEEVCEEHKPLELNQKKLDAKRTTNLSIPLNQNAVFYYSTLFTDEDDPKKTEWQEWTFDKSKQPSPVRFGQDDIMLEIKANLRNDRKISFDLTLSYYEHSGEQLVEWINEVKKDLINSIQTSIEYHLNTRNLKDKSKIFDYFNFNGTNNQLMIKQKSHLKRTNLKELLSIENDLRGFVRKSLRQNFSDDFPTEKKMSPKDRAELKKLVREGLNKYDSFKKIDDHANKLQHLLRLLDIIDSLKINLRISRQLNDPTNNQDLPLPEVDLYIAGTRD